MAGLSAVFLYYCLRQFPAIQGYITGSLGCILAIRGFGYFIMGRRQRKYAVWLNYLFYICYILFSFVVVQVACRLLVFSLDYLFNDVLVK